MIANILSLLNLFCGIFAMIYAFSGGFGMAAGAIMLAMVLDLFDGRVARMIKKTNPLGQYLDTFADMTTFCIAPGILFYSIIWGPNGYVFGANSEYEFLKNIFIFKYKIIGALAAFAFPFAGSLRLAKFMDEKQQNLPRQNYFIGMPSTFAGGTAALFMGFNSMSSLIDGLLNKYFPAILNFRLPLIIIVIIYFLYSFIMVCNLYFFRPSPGLLTFYKGMKPVKIISNILLVAAIVLFTKYFLVLGALFYLFRSFVNNLGSGKNFIS